MDREYIKTYVRTYLGGGDNPISVNVELSDDELEVIIKSAILWYNTYKGFRRVVFIEIVPNVVEYKLPDDAIRVYEVIPPGYDMDVSRLLTRSLFPIIGVPYDIFGSTQHIGIYSTFTQALQYNEMAKRILANDFEWEYRQEDNQLLVYSSSQNYGRCCVIYGSKEIQFDKLSPMDESLILKYSLASGKIIVGRKRSKFSDYPMVEGSQKLDGESLIAEAKEEMEQLTKTLQESVMPIGFITG